jgi:hypothetical protein
MEASKTGLPFSIRHMAGTDRKSPLPASETTDLLGYDRYEVTGRGSGNSRTIIRPGRKPPLGRWS